MSRAYRPWVVLGCAALAGGAGGVALERIRAAKQQVPRLTEAAVDRVVPPAPVMRPSRAPLADAAALEGLPAYPHAHPVDFSREMRAQGLDLHVAWFATSDSPEDVIRFYEEKLTHDSKLVVSHLYSESAGYVGYLEGPAKKMHLISVLRDREETLVFPSSSELSQVSQGPSSLPEGLPRVGGEEGATVVSFKDNGVLQDSVYATVPAKSLEEVRSLYEKGFTEQGWILSPAAHPPKEGLRLSARKGRSTATVVLSRVPPPAKPAIAVYLTLTTAGPP